MEVDLLDENLIVAIAENNKHKFYSSLNTWFKLIDTMPPNNPTLLNADALVSELVMYAIIKKYEIFFLDIKASLAYRINESILIRVYEYVSYAVIDYLKNELRIDISNDFETKYFDLAKILGPARINEILSTLKEKKIGYVLTWDAIQGFQKYFLNDYEKIYELFTAVKKRRGQPSKYNDADFNKLENLIAEGFKRKYAAKKILSEKGLSDEHIDSFLKIARERLPLKAIMKINKQKREINRPNTFRKKVN